MDERSELRIAHLEQQLRDERRLRDAAERKAATQASRAKTWQQRAEERTARIERLKAEQERARTLPGAVRKWAGAVRSAVTPDEPPTPADPDPVTTSGPGDELARRSRRPPGLPALQVAHLVDDVDLRRAVDETTGHDLRDSDAGLAEADLVVVDAAALDAADEAVRSAFLRWVELDARQPLVWSGPDAPANGPVLQVSPGDGVLRHTFDPGQDTPIGRAGGPPKSEEPGGPDEDDVDITDRASIARAARAEPVVGADDPVRAGDLRRRFVWEHHTPLAVLVDLARAAGVSFEDPVPEIAAILVSNRPSDLRVQLLELRHQLHPRLRVQVGCHGFSSSEVRRELDEVAQSLPVEVLELPSTRPLGWGLNRTIDAVSSPVLAKIDDDDHYGPGYLVDAVQALDYAQADIVGRVCGFTHLEGTGRTVLRRVGDEERYYDGTLVGATMVFRRRTWEQAPFPHKTLAEDVGLQRGTRSVGGRVYAASRWDFVYRRRVSGNTWRVPDDHFLATSEPAWDGWQPNLANLDQR